MLWMLVDLYWNHNDWTIQLIQNNPKGTEGNQLLSLARLDLPRLSRTMNYVWHTYLHLPFVFVMHKICLYVLSLWFIISAFTCRLCDAQYLPYCLHCSVCQPTCAKTFPSTETSGARYRSLFFTWDILHSLNLLFSSQISVAMLTWISRCLVCCIHSAALVPPSREL